jgi:predicted AlkP superfamily pyrophosphatase or phosphodiesterase
MLGMSLCSATLSGSRNRRLFVTVLVFIAAAAGLLAQGRRGGPVSATHRQLVIVVDGLRPDYVTPEVMPNLYALGQRGVVFANHHSVFPTVTRVNASSISTGTYPERHGLMGNTVYFPQVDADRFLDTSDRANLLKIDAATNGNLLTSQTLGETLQAAGKKLLVVSAGSTGSAFLVNHKVAGGAILHADYTLPDSLSADVVAAVGEPTANAPSDALNRRAVDLFLKVGLPKVDPSVTVMWLTDPDTTAHEHGIGDPVTVECLRRVDGEIKRVQDGLAAVGLIGVYDIWVTSDHGFSTHTGGVALADLLKPFARAMPDGSPRIVTGGDGAIYVRDHNRADVARIVTALQGASKVGAIFTAATTAGSLDGWVSGTLSFDVIRWNHDRSAEIMFSPDWTDDANAFGFKGTVMTGGVAGHGSSSPFDVHNTLIAAGPDLKRAAAINTPSANVDFAPTLLSLLGVAVPSTMEGRILSEAFTTGPAAARLPVRRDTHTVRTPDGSYAVTAMLSTVTTPAGSYRYFDSAKATRK